jgi:hypothetical protein
MFLLPANLFSEEMDHSIIWSCLASIMPVRRK